MAVRTSIASWRTGTAVWSALVVLIVLEAAQEVIGGLGPDTLYQDWIHDSVLVAATVLCLRRAASKPDERAAWIAIGAGLACWAAGSVTWSILYGGDRHPPYPSVADVWWLLWYPCTALGLWLLARRRARNFELHRWLDGVAVALIVVTWGAALFIEPVIAESEATAVPAIVTFTYPVLDVLLAGGILGLFGLMGWQPGRTWLVLGAGCLIIAGADAVYAVQFERSLRVNHDFDFVWTIGAVVIAAAAYGPPVRLLDRRYALGWRVIALPLAAQALAASIQVYSLIVGDLGHSERILTLILLVIVSLQIIEARPRAATPDDER